VSIRGTTFVATVALLLAAVGPAHASFAGENGKIVFSRSSATCNPNLYTINPDGTAAARVTSDPAGDGLDPSWSADGQRLTVEASHQCPDETGANKEIYYLNADGSGRTRLTFNGNRDNDPTWSPTGDRIAYIGLRLTPQAACTQQDDVFVKNVDGATPPEFLTNSTHFESDPDWVGSGLSYTLSEYYVDEECEVLFPGRRLLMTDYRGEIGDFDSPQADHYPNGTNFAVRSNDGDIVIIRQDGGWTEVSTNTPGVSESSPVWSPNGAFIAYAREGDIWVMNSDGSNQHPITSTPETEGAPDWQPIPTAHARPAGATPFRVPLVPAFKECGLTEQNREHGPPLAYPSCAPPRPGSSSLTVGVGDGSPAFGRSIGYLRLAVNPGVPGGVDDADVRIRLSLSNVMRASDLSEYTGELRVRLRVRLTDRSDGVSQTVWEEAHTLDNLHFTVPCTPTAEPVDKSLCDLDTTVDSLVPGAAAEGDRAIWALKQVLVMDGGPDEDGDTDDGALFATQGVFVP
jgi:Tol biopolymer transport system component